jgi:hypothetical protein
MRVSLCLRDEEAALPNPAADVYQAVLRSPTGKCPPLLTGRSQRRSRPVTEAETIE